MAAARSASRARAAPRRRSSRATPNVAGLGGFSGRESSVSAAWLATEVAAGHLRWVLADSRRRGAAPGRHAHRQPVGDQCRREGVQGGHGEDQRSVQRHDVRLSGPRQLRSSAPRTTERADALMLKFSRIATESERSAPYSAAHSAAADRRAILAVAAPSALADTVRARTGPATPCTAPASASPRWLASGRSRRATCTAGHRTYSAMWVGLGGYSAELGRARADRHRGRLHERRAGSSSSAWYELVPAPSRPIRMRVRPGDRDCSPASPSTGHRVVARDSRTRPRHRSFRKTFARLGDRRLLGRVDRRGAVGVRQRDTAAETLPLAELRLRRIRARQAQAVGGHAGAIADPAWDYDTDQADSAGGRRFVTLQRRRPPGAAIPSVAERRRATAFSVDVLDASSSEPCIGSAARRPAARPGYIVHPGRYDGTSPAADPGVRRSRSGQLAYELLARAYAALARAGDAAAHAHRPDAAPVLDHEPRRRLRRARSWRASPSRSAC